VDLLRGAAIVFMALDHARDYFSAYHFDPLNLTLTSPMMFFTRCVTDFCAPVFVFLAGTGTYLSLKRGRRTRQQSARFLATRGLWLIVLELTAIRFAWTFNLDYSILMLQVIWAIGWSMIVLAGLIFLPTPFVALVGITMIASHNLLDGIRLESFTAPDGHLSWVGWLFCVLHVEVPPVIYYPLIPWIGVMAAGYAFGAILLSDAHQRQRRLLLLGLALTAVFIALRAVNVYGDPTPWSVQKDTLFTVMSFLSTEKYPPSLLYLLMTLGPAIVALAFFESTRGRVAHFFVVLGRVPMFFYIIHLYLIHALALVAGYLSGFQLGSMATMFSYLPEDYGFGLETVYLVWITLILALYPLCSWYGGVKRHRKSRWLSYI
jgi:uncharacterized membrane protein